MSAAQTARIAARVQLMTARVLVGSARGEPDAFRFSVLTTAMRARELARSLRARAAEWEQEDAAAMKEGRAA